MSDQALYVSSRYWRSHSWHEEDSVVLLGKVVSDSTTGAQWVERLTASGINLDMYAKSVLRSPGFNPTSGVTTEVALLKGAFFKNDMERLTANVQAEASRRGLVKVSAEVACLLRVNFSDVDVRVMGLRWVVTMHDPMPGRYPRLLGVRRSSEGPCLRAFYDRPNLRWPRFCGFAFAVPPV